MYINNTCILIKTNLKILQGYHDSKYLKPTPHVLRLLKLAYCVHVQWTKTYPKFADAISYELCESQM